MDPTCGLVDKIQCLVFDLIRKYRYLVHYHRNIVQLNELLDELNCRRASLQHQIEEARRNVEEFEEEVLHWLREVDNLSEQVQQFHDEKNLAKTECNITSCPNPWLRYKLSKRAVRMALAVNILVSHHVPLLSNGIDSRVEIQNQIMEALQNPRFNMIGLCGLGGVGKTTIAEEVAKNQKIFEKVIMATVSQELKIERIQDEIAEKLSMQLSENNKDVRAFRLCERLKQEKNMLLILDDLWEELDLREIGIPFVSVENYSEKNESCKILLTSRNKMLLSNLMKCQKIVEVGVLSEDGAFELFKKIAKLSTDSSSLELIAIATDIVRKCGGLPLAIATYAKYLRSKDINVWKDARARLNNPLTRNITLTREVDTSLKRSYDHLSSSEYKQIFLLSAMFSHDPSIEDLLMYSVGLDIIDGMENMEDACVKVSAIASKLKSLNLLLDSISSHHVTINDVFRDVALSIASNELHAFIHRGLKEWPDKNLLQGCEGICLQESKISDLPEELYVPRLQFFLLNSIERDLNIPNMFFKSSKELKLLAFTNVHFSSLLSLVFLHKLKALCLHSCLLEDIAKVKSLKNLKVLSLAYSEVQRLPIELAELTSLQMLNLSHCSNLKVIPQKLLSSLKKLEVLYLGNSFHQWKVEGYSEANENASLDELTDLPISSLEIHIPKLSMLPENLFLKMNLRRYKIFIGESWTWQGNYGASNILKLELESRIDLTAQLRNLPKGVEDLHLYGSNGQENVLYNLAERGFPCLRHLQIERNDDIKYIVLNSAHEDAFPILESLELKNLKALENLCEGPNDIVFCQLHTLKMENLPAPTGDFIIKDGAANSASNKIFKSLFKFPELMSLRIESCPKFLSNQALTIEGTSDHLLQNEMMHACPNVECPSLRKLRIVNCPTFVTLPNNVSAEVDNSLNKHSTFVLFEDIKEDFSPGGGKMKIPPKLESLELMMGLPNLQLWTQEPEIPVFEKLTSLKIINCGSFQKLFSISVAEHLSSLKLLALYGCVDMVHVLQGVRETGLQVVVFKKLEKLLLKHLPRLTSFCQQDVYFGELPELKMVIVEDIPNMNTFVKQPLSTPKLKQVHVTYITKCWKGDLNDTIRYLHQNHDKLINEVWESDQSRTRHHSDTAESSSHQ